MWRPTQRGCAKGFIHALSHFRASINHRWTCQVRANSNAYAAANILAEAGLPTALCEKELSSGSRTCRCSIPSRGHLRLARSNEPHAFKCRHAAISPHSLIFAILCNTCFRLLGDGCSNVTLFAGGMRVSLSLPLPTRVSMRQRPQTDPIARRPLVSSLHGPHCRDLSQHGPAASD